MFTVENMNIKKRSGMANSKKELWYFWMTKPIAYKEGMARTGVTLLLQVISAYQAAYIEVDDLIVKDLDKTFLNGSSTASF